MNNNMYGFQPNFGYQNPYMPNGGFQNAYQQSMMPMQTPQQEMLQGAIVDSVDVVKAKNCSLDGSPTYYPLSDKKEIYCKQLNPQTGAGMMLKYRLVEDDATPIIDNNQIGQMISQLHGEMSELKALVLDNLTKPAIGGVK